MKKKLVTNLFIYEIPQELLINYTKCINNVFKIVLVKSIEDNIKNKYNKFEIFVGF